MPEGTQILVPPAPPYALSVKSIPNVLVVGDGVTDDTAGLNAALAYAAAHANLPLYLPPTFTSAGNLTSYLMTSGSLLYAPGQVLTGAGIDQSTITINDHDGLAPLNGGSAYNSRWNFRGLTLQGNSSAVRFTTGMRLGPGQTHWMADLRIAGFCRGIDIDSQPGGPTGASGVGNIAGHDIVVDMPAYPSQFLIAGQPDFGIYLHSTGGGGRPQGMYFSRPMISGNRTARGSGWLLSDGTSAFSSVSLNNLPQGLWQASGVQVFLVYPSPNVHTVPMIQVNVNGSNPLAYTLQNIDSTPVTIPVGATAINCHNIRVVFDITPPAGYYVQVNWNDPTIRAAVRIELGNENDFTDCDLSGAYVGFDCDFGPNRCSIASSQVSFQPWRFGPFANAQGRPSRAYFLYGTPSNTPITGSFPIGARAITSASGGSNYAVGDLLTVGGGTLALPSDERAVLQVLAVSGGAIVNQPNGNPGIGVLRPSHYTTAPPNPANIIANTGGGTGAPIVVDYETCTTATGAPPRILDGVGSLPSLSGIAANAPATSSITPVALNVGVVLQGANPNPRRVTIQGTVYLATGQGGALGVGVSYDGGVTTQYLNDWFIASGAPHAVVPVYLDTQDTVVAQPAAGAWWQILYTIVATAAVTAASAALASPGIGGYAPGDIERISVGYQSSALPAARTFPTGTPNAGLWPGGLSASMLVTTQVQVTVNTTQVVSASVANGGGSGTPGAVTLACTTGSGIRAVLGGTINGSGVLVGPLTIITIGAYTSNPAGFNGAVTPNVPSEPVTGGGLVGATVSLNMGVNAFTLSQPGLLAQAPPAASNPLPSSPATGFGNGATFNVTWAPSGETVQLMPGYRMSAGDAEWATTPGAASNVLSP